VGGLQIAGTEGEVAAQVEVQVHVCIVLGRLVVGGLQIVGSKSEVAARVEARSCVHSCGWVGYR